MKETAERAEASRFICGEGTAMYEMLKRPKTCDTVQCLRKRVSGNGSHIPETDLFYDKSDGQYYKNMREIRYRRDCQIDFDEYHRYLHAVQKDRSAKSILLAKLSDEPDYVILPQPWESDSGETFPVLGQKPTHNSGTVYCEGMLASKGTEEVSPPPTVRLYSEAEMTHASTLAGTMTDAAHYNAFKEMDDTGLHGAGYRGSQAPLIKATEFDDRDHVMARYSSGRQYNATARAMLADADARAKSERGTGLTKDEKDALRNVFMRAVKDAFMKGRLLAARHSRSYGDLKPVFEAAGKTIEEVIDNVIQEIETQGTAGEEYASADDITGVVRLGIKAEIIKILADGAALGDKAKAAVLKQFRIGYSAVSSGWPAQRERLAERESLPSLEISYGGKTGDMTHPHKPHVAQRKYDMIQSTFFWMPGAGSLDNAKAILDFFIAQYYKLKPGGIIRLVSFSNNEQRPGDARTWEEKENQYGEAAEWVFRELVRIPYYTDVRKMLFYKADGQGSPAGGMPYSEVLSTLKLNPVQEGEPLYRPLWTDTNKAVGAEGKQNGNLILQARKPVSRLCLPN